mgnify:CR=1 FL=1
MRDTHERRGAACSVPDYAEVEIFHHTVRGETQETIRKRVDKAIETAKVRSKVEVVFRQSPAEGFDGGFDAYCIDEDGEFSRNWRNTVFRVCGRPAPISLFSEYRRFQSYRRKAEDSDSIIRR